MKTATLPSIRVEPEFRHTVESLLHNAETLTEFVENAVRETVMRRSNQAEFLARGMASLQAAAKENDYVDADDVMAKLRQRLAVAKRQIATPQQ